MPRALAALTALVLAVSAATAVARPAPPLLTFAYDRAQPLGFRDKGVVARPTTTVSIHDVSYLSQGRRVAGYLVEPAGAARRPAVVVVHGSGGDRRELLGSAVALAERGFVALTITEPSSAHPPPSPSSVAQLLAQSQTETVADVVAIRRAADLLGSLPVVAAGRLGYLGWSAGAKAGTFVAAADRRFRALALLSAGAEQVSAYVAAAPPADRGLVRRKLGSIDPIRYVAAARPGTVLLEDGTRDSVVPHRALLNIVHAAPRGTVVRWYRAGHGLDAGAYTDAFAWLSAKLR